MTAALLSSRRVISLGSLCLLLWAATTVAAPLQVTRLRCEYLENPHGVDVTAPRLSWIVQGDPAVRAQRVTARQIQVASSAEALAAGQADLWDSGRVADGNTVLIPYAGQPLASRQACHWRVRVWNETGEESTWSETAEWSMGLLQESDWTAQWISVRDETPVHDRRDALELPPARHYRREFTADKQVVRAMAYVSALGLYELHLNGQRVSDRWLTPGWSDYRRRAYYNVYDVTAQVRAGDNAVGAVVADGWYAGYVGYGLLVGYGPHKAGRNFYGKTPALLVQLELEYADGSRSVVNSDDSWQVTSAGPIRTADLLMGETCDGRLLKPFANWAQVGFPGENWESAILAASRGSIRAPYHDSAGPREVELGFVRPATMQSHLGAPVRVTQEIPAQAITSPSTGVYIFNLGQNIAGVARLKLKGAAGTVVTARFGEMLHPDGRLMTENLRRAKATDTYTLAGDPAGEEWTPTFTYHGFQFVELSGLTEAPALDTVTGLVLHSDTPLVSEFTCSDEMVNQLFRNIVWTQRANYVEVPTDCPQRDERLGWTGDAQMYAATAAYQADIGAFMTKWMDDLVESQDPEGPYPSYAPYPMQHGSRKTAFGTAWMDCGVIVPYQLFRAYGDVQLLATHWPHMKKFMNFRERSSPYFQGINIGNEWGDWLSLEKTPLEVVDAAYFAKSARMMSEMAAALGKTDEQQHFAKVAAEVAKAFARNYLNDDGTLAVNTQTAYALALDDQLVPADLRPKLAEQLVKLVIDRDARMATGFIGTKPLIFSLTATGHNDLAARLLQSRRFPSWGYEIANGATTIWERWNSYTTEDGFMNPSMNSFSHYAFGSVGEWMFAELAGIQPGEPGYSLIDIAPRPPTPGSNPEHPAISHVATRYDSIRGLIGVEWTVADGQFEAIVELPANTTGRIKLPTTDTAAMRLDGQLLGSAGITVAGDGTFMVTSGRYVFTCPFQTTPQP